MFHTLNILKNMLNCFLVQLETNIIENINVNMPYFRFMVLWFALLKKVASDLKSEANAEVT